MVILFTPVCFIMQHNYFLKKCSWKHQCIFINVTFRFMSKFHDTSILSIDSRHTKIRCKCDATEGKISQNEEYKTPRIRTGGGNVSDAGHSVCISQIGLCCYLMRLFSSSSAFFSSWISRSCWASFSLSRWFSATSCALLTPV